MLCITMMIVTCHDAVTDLPAGQTVKLLVGFSNKGSQDFIVESMDAAFRYPQDYSFYIQNVCSPSVHQNLQSFFACLPKYLFKAVPLSPQQCVTLLHSAVPHLQVC